MTAATTVYARFRETALRRGEAGFLNVLPETAGIYGIAAEEISYRAMLDRVERWRAAFASCGYGEGHRVGLLLQNRPVFVELWFALNALGVSVVPINPDLRLSELEYIIAHSEMNAAFVLAERRDEVETAARQAGRPIPVVTSEDEVPAPFGGLRQASTSDGSSECALLYTSGTTGQPKGIVRPSGGHLVAMAWSLRHVFDAHPGETFWAASDIGWVVGHSYITYAPLIVGCTTVLYEGKPVGTPDAGAFWRVISEHDVSTLFTAPTAFRAIRQQDPKGTHIGRYDRSRFRALSRRRQRSRSCWRGKERTCGR